MSRYQNQRVYRDQGFVQRFGIAEHLSEGFAASCIDVCAQPNLDPLLQTACDIGSQAYCSSANIVSAECSPYVDRVVRTRAAQKTSTVYSNPVSIPAGANKTITDYYNALGDAGKNYVASNIANLSSPSVTRLMNIVQAEGGDSAMFNSIADGAIAACVQSPSSDCTSVPWVKTRVNNIIAGQVAQFSTASLGSILDFISANLNHYLKFEDSYAPMRVLLLSKMTIADITNPVLIALREKSAIIRTAIDLIIINYVCDTTLSAIPVASSGQYDVDLSAKPKLYAKTIDTFMYTLVSRQPANSDKLLSAWVVACKTNYNRCSTVDPLTDPTCVAMTQSGRPEAVAAMNKALASYCLNPANVTGDSCIGYTNKLTDESAKREVLAVGYTAAIKADGTIDATVLNKYGGMKDYIKVKTADIVTKDADGNIVITPSCGTANSMPVDQCKQICTLYPDVCLDDQIRKAQLPQYRYAKDGFNGGDEGFVGRSLGRMTICSPDEDDLSSQTLLYMVLLAIAFACMYFYFRSSGLRSVTKLAREESENESVTKNGITS